MDKAEAQSADDRNQQYLNLSQPKQTAAQHQQQQHSPSLGAKIHSKPSGYNFRMKKKSFGDQKKFMVKS